MHLTYCEDFHTYPDYPVYGLPPCLGCSQSYLFPWVCMHPSSCKTVFSIKASTIFNFFLVTYNFIIFYEHIQVHEIKIILIILVMCWNFWDYICSGIVLYMMNCDLWCNVHLYITVTKGLSFKMNAAFTGYLDHKRKIKATYQYVVRESYWTNL